jgi:hypothetical protein
VRQATCTYSLSSIFRKAWGIARHNAKHHGGRPRLHFAQALRQTWAEAKATAQRIAESKARVQAEIERIRFASSPIGRARHERHMTAYRAKCEADLARALEMSCRLTQKPVREAA